MIFIGVITYLEAIGTLEDGVAVTAQKIGTGSINFELAARNLAAFLNFGSLNIYTETPDGASLQFQMTKIYGCYIQIKLCFRPF